MKIQFDKPPGSAQENNGLSVRYAAAKRQVPRWRWYLLLAMVLTPPAYLVTRFMVAFWWETSPAIVVTEQVVVRARTAGLVTQIAGVGAQVGMGQPVVAVQATTPPSAQPLTPALSAETANAAPRELSRELPSAASVRQVTLDEALRLAQRQLGLQQERLATMQYLRAEGAATRQELDNARIQELQARAVVNSAQADASENRSLVARERLASEQSLTSAAAVPQRQAPQPVAALTIDAADVNAPFDALVVRQLAHLGEWVERGADVALLQGPAPAMIHTYLSPEKALYAQVGRQATLRFMDGGRIRAEVVDVVAEAERTPAERTSPLTPRMPSIVARLRPMEPLPASYRIHYLPLDVRFDWVWSSPW